MSGHQFEMFMDRLYEETNRLRLNFASLMFDTQMDLEKRLPVEQLVDIIVNRDVISEGVLAECTSFSQVFNKLSDSVSFFDYGLLKYLINHYGSDAIKKKLEIYIGYFREFSKRRVNEYSRNALSDHDSGSSEKILVFVADTIIENLTVDELRKFICSVYEILDSKLVLQVHSGGGRILIVIQLEIPGTYTIIQLYGAGTDASRGEALCGKPKYLDRKPSWNIHPFLLMQTSTVKPLRYRHPRY